LVGALLDILLVLARNKTIIVRTGLVFTAAQDYFLVSLRALLGMTYALLAPGEGG